MSATCPHGVTLRSGCYRCNPEYRERDEAAYRKWERRGDLAEAVVKADQVAQECGVRLTVERTLSGQWYVAFGHVADGTPVFDSQSELLSCAVEEATRKLRASPKRSESTDL